MGIQTVEGVDGGGFWFGDEEDLCLCLDAGLLTGLERLVLGSLRPDGGDGETELEGDATQNGGSDFLFQGVHEMLDEFGEIVGRQVLGALLTVALAIGQTTVVRLAMRTEK